MIFVLILLWPWLLVVGLWNELRDWATGRAAIVLVALTLTACQSRPLVVATVPTVALMSTTAAAPSSLRYFGYFGSNYIGHDSGPETADHTNVVWVNAQEWNWRAQVEDAARRGQSTILNVFGILFDPPTARLYPDAPTRWAAFAPSIVPVLQHVVALYHIDEPGTNAAGHPAPGCAYPWEAGSGPCWVARLDTMRVDVETANSLIKGTFPQTPIAAAIGSHELFGDDFAGWTRLPVGYDWVGFDCYGDFNNCARNGHSVPETLAKLRSLMTPGQRILFFPDGSRYPNYFGGDVTNGSEAGLADRAVQYVALALATPDTIGIFPYLWASYGGTTDGVRDLPEARAVYTRVGRAITRGAIGPGPWGSFAFGLPGDVPFMVRDSKHVVLPALFRPSSGTWYLNRPDAAGSSFHDFDAENVTAFQFGLPGDIPFAVRLQPWCRALACPVVYRPSTGTWYISTLGFVPCAPVAIQFGAPGDIPKIVYWGTEPYIAVYRPSTRQTIASTTNQSYRRQDVAVW